MNDRFYRELNYKGHRIKICTQLRSTPMINAPVQVDRIERCYIDGVDMTHEVEPPGGDLDRWEQEAKECVDAHFG